MKFGLIYHMFFISEIAERSMSTRLTPCGFRLSDEFVHETLKNGKILAYDTTIELKTDSCIVLGRDWVIPLTPSEIFQNQNQAIDMTVEACKMAQEWGVDIIGLGLLLGKIGRRGEDVRKQIDVPITNGDSYLVYNSVQTLDTIMKILSLDLSKEEIAIFGFPNLIGQHLAEYLMFLGAEITLVTKYTPFINRVTKKITPLGRQAPKVVSSIPEAQKTCRFFFTTGSTEQLISDHDFVAPAIVIDVSFPRNVQEVSDRVFIVDSGLVDVPKDGLNITGYEPDRAMACLTELMVLSLEGYRMDFSLGKRISVNKIRQVGNWALKYGFDSDQLYSYARPIQKENIRKFYHEYFSH